MHPSAESAAPQILFDCFADKIGDRCGVPLAPRIAVFTLIMSLNIHGLLFSNK